MTMTTSLTSPLKFTVSACVVFFSLTVLDTMAAITEEQALSFGEFGLGPNDVVSTMWVPHNGQHPRATNKLYPIALGQRGQYRLTGYPAFTPLIITINDFQLTRAFSEPFNIEDITFDSVMTDTNGEATLIVGATLKTTGSMTVYGDGDYSGNMDIVISW